MRISGSACVRACVLCLSLFLYLCVCGGRYNVCPDRVDYALVRNIGTPEFLRLRCHDTITTRQTFAMTSGEPWEKVVLTSYGRDVTCFSALLAEARAMSMLEVRLHVCMPSLYW